MKIDISMPNEVRMILDRLHENGHEAVIIGGCVRDYILKEIPHDWDIATSALPEEVMEYFKEYRLMTAGLKHGTVTIIIDRIPYEVTTFRIDGKYTDHRRPDSVDFTSDLVEDIMRRDFTINSLAHDGENLIDLCGGYGDILCKSIRCVGNPDDRFQEDPLRILRGVRFAAQFGFDLAESTKDAMFRNAYLLNKIAMERKQAEFTKAICSSNVNVLAEYKHILSYVMPGIEYIDNFEEVLSYIGETKELCIKLTYIIDCLKIMEYTDIVELISKIMKYPNQVSKSVCNIVKCKKEFITDDMKCARYLLSKYPIDDVVRALEYKKSKINDDSNKKKIEKTLILIYRAFNEQDKFCYDFKHLKINGHDLKSLGVQELEIKNCLSKLLQMVITEQLENDKEVLIQVIKNSMI